METRDDLAALVRSRLTELNKSVRSLAAESVDPTDSEGGPQWKRSTLDNLVNGVAVKPPTPAQLRALAHVLLLPLGVVQEAAAAQFFGMDTVWSEDREARALVHDYQSMSPEDQAWLRAILESRRGQRGK